MSDFVVPPHSFTDDEQRDITIERGSEADLDDLVSMYCNFERDDRSQGVPPMTEEKIRDWMSYIFPEDAYHIIAYHGDRLVGHSFLVPADDDHYELAIFVLREYQAAHIGTELMYTLLGLGQSEGITDIWLSVESRNNHAITLYENIGFEREHTSRTELEMAIALDEVTGE